MKRRQLRASLLPLSVAFALGACGKNNVNGVWDSAAMTWEAAPPREIIDARGEGGGGTVDPGGMMRSFTKLCKETDEPWCCYDGKTLYGIPLCSWKGMVTGNSVTFDTAYREDQKVTLPDPVTLISPTPDRWASAEDCADKAVGFVLQGKGMSEGSLVSTISYYYVGAGGNWRAAGGGATAGLVVGSNSDPAARGDAAPGSLPPLEDKLDAEKCTGNAEYIANVVMFDSVSFELDGVKYEADFRRDEGETKAYYVRIDRGY